MTTQTPTWRDNDSGRPHADRAVPGVVVGGRYALRTPIGHGGMGTVWRATDQLLRRDVAVKEVLLPRTMPPNERDALCERTLREARAAAALSHPSVVQVYDVVTDADRPWIVMELLEARSLADMVIDDGPLAGRAVAKIGVAMLGALEVAHAAGVLHRDVKPANVLICTDGRCVLTDFGVARLPQESNLTTPGMVLGSPHFISPERAVGGAFGPPSDLFSLGVTLYTAVEGGPPFDRGDPFETMRAVVEEAPRPVRLAGALTPVLWGLLEKDPGRRWTVGQARGLLRELLNGPLSRSSSAHPDTDPYAVVRQPVTPPPPPPPAPSGQVGGRAMLDPNESLTGHLARLQARAGGYSPTGEYDHGPQPQPGPRAPSGAWPATEAMPPSGPGGPGTRRAGAHSHRSGGTRFAGGPGGGIAADLAHGARALGGKAKRLPVRSRLIVGVGLVAALAIASFATLTGAFSGGSKSPNGGGPGPGSSASAEPTQAPLIDAQEFRHKDGIVVNVPAGWKKSAGSSFVDFTDPRGDRKVRINVEPAGDSATRFVEEGEKYLKSRINLCPEPYTRLGLREAELAGRPAAELEYTCGPAESASHGIRRAVVVDGKAYYFSMTVPDSRFEESRLIFEELVRSFALTV